MAVIPATMTLRTNFGKPARRFTMTVSRQEGYKGGPVHELAEVTEILRQFATAEGVELGGEVLPSMVFYSYRDSGTMVFHDEPAACITGLFPPNKFGHASDDDLVQMLGKLAAYLAGGLGQVSVHAEICGVHYSWKREGELTSHEEAVARTSAVS